jgi:hypothetical protein
MAAAAAQQFAAALQPIAVSPRLPPLASFWTHDPVGWFQQVEAEFDSVQLSTAAPAAFTAILRALPPDVNRAVRTLTSAVTAATPGAYHLLKTALLEEYQRTPLQNSFSILEMPAMGTRTPMQLVNEVLALLPEQGDTLVNAIILQRFPERIRSQVASKGHLSPKELGREAMHIYNALSPAVIASMATEPIASVHYGGGPALPLEQDRETVAAARPPSRASQRSRRSPTRRPQTPRRRRSRSRDSTDSSPSPDICWFHHTFGRAARRCRPPCKWQENE